MATFESRLIIDCTLYIYIFLPQKDVFIQWYSPQKSPFPSIVYQIKKYQAPKIRLMTTFTRISGFRLSLVVNKSYALWHRRARALAHCINVIIWSLNTFEVVECECIHNWADRDWSVWDNQNASTRFSCAWRTFQLQCGALCLL